MSFDRDRPINGLPPSRPRVELATRAVLRRAIGAGAALEASRGAGTRLPRLLSGELRVKAADGEAA